MLDKLATGLAAGTLMLAVGWSLAAGLGALRRRTVPSRAAYSFLAGYCLLALTLWALSLTGGVRLDRFGILSVASALILLGTTAAAVRRRLGTSASPRATERPRAEAAKALGRQAPGFTALMLLVAGLQVCGILFQAATDPITDWDGRMTWATLSRFLFAEGTVTPSALTDPTVYVTHPSYPLLLPLGQVVSLALAPTSLRPFAARPLYALFFLALLVVVHDAVRCSSGKRIAALVVVAAAVLPMLATQLDGGAAGAYSDVPLGCLLGGGLLLATARRRGEQPPGDAWLAGLLLAGAAVSKNEGLLLAPLALVASQVFAPHRRREHLRHRLALGARIVAPLAGAVALLLQWRRQIPNRFDEAYFERFSPERILSGLPDSLVGPCGRALEMLGRFDDWGLFWWLFAATTAVGWRAMRRREGAAPLAVAAGAALIAGAAYAVYPNLDLVEVTWNRLVLQVVVPILLLFALAIRGCRARLRRWGSFARFSAMRAAIVAAPPLSFPPSGVAGNLLAALLLGVTTALALPTAIRGFSNAVGPGNGDPFLNLYFLRWGARALDRGLDGFWNAPFYHPTAGVLSHSDHLLGPSTLAWFTEALGLGTVPAYNTLLLLSFVVGGWAVFWVLTRSGASGAAALFAAVAVTFTHFRLDQLSHLQVLLMQWIPLALWSFDRLLERPAWGRAGLFVGFYALHVSGGTYLAYMLHFPLAILAINRFADAEGRKSLTERRPRFLLGAVAAACTVISVAVFLPYVLYAGGMGLQRLPAEVAQRAAVAWSWLTPSSRSLIAGLSLGPPYREDNGLFPGFLPLIFAAVGLASLARFGGAARWRSLPLIRRRVALGGLLLLAIAVGLADLLTLTGSDRAALLGGISFHGYRGPALLALSGLGAIGWAVLRRAHTSPNNVAATGPPGNMPGLSAARIWPRGLLLAGMASAVLVHPLVFITLRSWVPGLDGLRVPQRFWAFALPALALAVAIGFDAVRASFVGRTPRALFSVAVFGLLALEFAPRQFEWHPVPTASNPPGLVALLRDDPTVRGILVLPITGDHREAENMLFASLHWKPIANGYSSALPVSYRRLLRMFSQVPRPDLVPELRRLGITHIQLHWDRISPGMQPAINQWLAGGERNGNLRLHYEKDQVLLYALGGD